MERPATFRHAPIGNWVFWLRQNYHFSVCRQTLQKSPSNFSSPNLVAILVKFIARGRKLKKLGFEPRLFNKVYSPTTWVKSNFGHFGWIFFRSAWLSRFSEVRVSPLRRFSCRIRSEAIPATDRPIPIRVRRSSRIRSLISSPRRGHRLFRRKVPSGGSEWSFFGELNNLLYDQLEEIFTSLLQRIVVTKASFL